MGRIVENQSNEGLGPTGLHLTIGNVPRINGEDAEEIPGYVCSRHELIQLVEHWWAEVLWIGWMSRAERNCTGRAEQDHTTERRGVGIEVSWYLRT